MTLDTYIVSGEYVHCKNFLIEQVPCEGIGREGKAVSLRHTSSGLIEIVRQVEGQTQDQFFAVIVKFDC